MFLQKPMLGTQLDHSDSLNNPVLDLLMNEGHGDIVHDLSGHGNHGTLHGFAFPPTRTSGWNPGLDGVALTFDGVDDYIDCGNGKRLNMSTDPFTLLARIVSSSSTTQMIFSKRQSTPVTIGYAVYLRSNGRVAGLMQNDAAITTSTDDGVVVADGKEHDVIVVFDRGGTDKIIRYADGVQTGTQDDIADVGDITSDVNLLIGKKAYVDSGYLTGSIARLRILPRAMSAFEVMQTQIDPYGVYQQ